MLCRLPCSKRKRRNHEAARSAPSTFGWFPRVHAGAFFLGLGDRTKGTPSSLKFGSSTRNPSDPQEPSRAGCLGLKVLVSHDHQGAIAQAFGVLVLLRGIQGHDLHEGFDLLVVHHLLYLARVWHLRFQRVQSTAHWACPMSLCLREITCGCGPGKRL